MDIHLCFTDGEGAGIKIIILLEKRFNVVAKQGYTFVYAESRFNINRCQKL